MSANDKVGLMEACCAHLIVKYTTSESNGLTTGWWECKDCKHRFSPIPHEVEAACSKPVAPGRLDEIVLAAVDKCNPHSDGERFCLYNVIETAIKEALAAPPQVSAARHCHYHAEHFSACANCADAQAEYDAGFAAAEAGAVSAPRCPNEDEHDK